MQQLQQETGFVDGVSTLYDHKAMSLRVSSNVFSHLCNFSHGQRGAGLEKRRMYIQTGQLRQAGHAGCKVSAGKCRCDSIGAGRHGYGAAQYIDIDYGQGHARSPDYCVLVGNLELAVKIKPYSVFAHEPARFMQAQRASIMARSGYELYGG